MSNLHRYTREDMEHVRRLPKQRDDGPGPRRIKALLPRTNVQWGFDWVQSSFKCGYCEGLFYEWQRKKHEDSDESRAGGR